MLNLFGPHGHRRQWRLRVGAGGLCLGQGGAKRFPHQLQLHLRRLQHLVEFGGHRGPSLLLRQRRGLRLPMRHISAQRGHALQSVLPRLGGQNLDALGNQDRRFSLHLDAVLQVLNGLDAVDQGLAARGQGLTRQSRAGFGRIALPSLRLLNIKRRLLKQLLRFV